MRIKLLALAAVALTMTLFSAPGAEAYYRYYGYHHYYHPLLSPLTTVRIIGRIIGTITARTTSRYLVVTAAA